MPIVDQNYRDRLGALLSIDDLIAGVVSTLEELKVLDNTIIIVSSDHGYHLGNWRLPMEKMWPFETDQRIPFFIRGPGIEAGQVIDAMGVNMDIAPTLLDAAGIPAPDSYDGKSLLPLLQGGGEERAEALQGWRTRTVISFAEGYDQWWGEVTLSAVGVSLQAVERLYIPCAGLLCSSLVCSSVIFFPRSTRVAIQVSLHHTIIVLYSRDSCNFAPPPHLPRRHRQNPSHSKVDPQKIINPPRASEAGGARYSFDNPENQWRALRVANETRDVSFVQWDPLFLFQNVSSISHEALWDLSSDPHQLTNKWSSLGESEKAAWREELEREFACAGATCS